MRYLLDAVYLILVLIAAPILLRAKSRCGLYSRFLGRTGFAACGVALARRGQHLHSWRERNAASGGITVWFHGVSVGEIHLLRNVVARWRARRPDVRCVVSSTTDTGIAEAQKSFPDLAVIRWPLDFSWAVDRALCEVRPDLVVLAESELWPNFLLAAKRRGVPVVAINVRLSPRSLRRYRLVRSIAKRWLGLVERFAVQTEAYAAALSELGVDLRRVTVMGSVKYDGVTGDRGNVKTAELRRVLNIGDDELVWIAGSTQSSEEEIALDVYQRLKPRFPNLRLILVPRQRERFDEVAELLRSRGVAFVRRSKVVPHPVTPSPRHPVILLDTIGELSAAWGLADVAFVGGSLDGRRGGQNMIEPAAYGAAVLFGPHTWNFRDTAERLVAADAGVVVRDAAAMETVVGRLLADPAERDRLGAAARRLVQEQQGATQRTLDVLDQFLDPFPGAPRGLSGLQFLGSSFALPPSQPVAVHIAYFNGHFVPDHEAKLALSDPGFVWGATVVDRVRTYGRKYFRLREHVARFRRSCELCRIPLREPDAELMMFAQHLLKENGEVTSAEIELSLIMFATPGEGQANIGMHTSPVDVTRYEKLLANGATLVTPATQHLAEQCVPRQVKMRSRMFWWIAEHQARDVDPDATALLLDFDGLVTETSFANFVIVRDRVIVSPPRETVLDGISLRYVEELAGQYGIEFVENPLRPEDCYAADEALLTGTPFGVAGVSSLNGRPIPWPGPVLQRLHAGWSAEVGVDIWHGFLPAR